MAWNGLLVRILTAMVLASAVVGSTGELASVDYSDQNTPDLAFAYDRLGRLVSATDGQGTRQFSYNGLDQLASESLPGLPGASLDRTYDSLGRTASVAGTTGSNLHFQSENEVKSRIE